METDDFFKKRLAQALLVFVLVVANPPSTRATTVRPLDLPELVQRAEVIADVTVVATASFLVSPAGGKAIQTDVRFEFGSPEGSGNFSVHPQFLRGHGRNSQNGSLRYAKVPGWGSIDSFQLWPGQNLRFARDRV